MAGTLDNIKAALQGDEVIDEVWSRSLGKYVPISRAVVLGAIDYLEGRVRDLEVEIQLRDHALESIGKWSDGLADRISHLSKMRKHLARLATQFDAEAKDDDEA